MIHYPKVSIDSTITTNKSSQPSTTDCFVVQELRVILRQGRTTAVQGAIQQSRVRGHQPGGSVAKAQVVARHRNISARHDLLVSVVRVLAFSSIHGRDFHEISSKYAKNRNRTKFYVEQNVQVRESPLFCSRTQKIRFSRKGRPTP